MQNLARFSNLAATLTTILICATPVKADPIIISVTAPPGLSFGIGTIGAVWSTAWSQSNDYTGVSIAVLVDSFLVGGTPSANAYLSTRIGPGTTASDEIAHTQFTVPTVLPVCSPSSCGAMVTLFSSLSLGPGQYFLTLSPDPGSIGTVGWFPALDPTVVLDTGVAEGASFRASATASYAPASTFSVAPFVMNFSVTGTQATQVPEPATATLVGCGALVLLLNMNKRIRKR